VAGYATEYGGIRFALLFIVDFALVLVWSGVLSTVFLQGYRGPFLPSHLWFLLKTVGFMFLFIWLRATLPRLRYDQLMKFGWKVLLPVATLNALVTAILVVAI
jgi:NADH-quinone oxidoreductase subunit H